MRLTNHREFHFFLKIKFLSIVHGINFIKGSSIGSTFTK